MYEVSNKRKSIKRRKNKSLFYNFHNFVKFILCFCLIIAMVTTTLLNNIIKESQDSGNSEIIAGDTSTPLLVDREPAEEYPDIKHHTLNDLKSSGYRKVYVPSVPSEVSDGEAVSTISEALTKIPEGGIIWLTQDITVDTVTLNSGKIFAISSYGNQQYNITKDGTSENMFTISDKSELVIENVNIDATGNNKGRTISLSNSSVLTLGQGTTLQNNTSYGAIYADNSSVCIDGGTISNNTATGEVGKKTYGDDTKYVFDSDKAGKQALGGAVLMVNESLLALTSGEIKNNTAITGGAIYVDNLSEMLLKDGTISGNTAISSDDIASVGGAIAVDNSGNNNIFLTGMSFNDNKAGKGGAFYISMNSTGIDVSIVDGSFTGNHADGDGSILLDESGSVSLNITGGTYSQNTAGGNGGFNLSNLGSTTYDTSVVIESATFKDNTAYKGACFTIGNTNSVNSLTVLNSEFTGNKTQHDGGVLYVQRRSGLKQMLFENSKFYNNTSGISKDPSSGAGALALFTPDSELVVRNCEAIGNYSYTNGGFLYWGDYDTNSSALIDGGLYKDNEAVKNGGAFYVNNLASTVIFNGGTYTGNHAGFSGGAAYVQTGSDSQTYIQGDAQIIGNSADVNAGAISFKRAAKGDAGTATLVDCDIIGNWCNADFDLYTGSDLEPTKHYNTGGVYVAEDVVLHIYDGLVTENYIESGYDKNMVGSGIGLCPNANAYFYPEHGALVYNNGESGTETMDIVAVPYDKTITHEIPAKLYISDMTPDGRNYNWTNFDGNKARTGEYNWDGVLNEKLTGISLMAMVNNSEYQGEDNLNPVGFKANIDGTQNNQEIMTMDIPFATGSKTTNEFEPKVIIKDNYTKSALYGAGGVMVNGKLIAGNLEISVEKKTVGLTEEEKKTKEFEFTLEITATKQNSYWWDSSNPFAQNGDELEVTYTRTGPNITGEKTGKAKFTLTTEGGTSKLNYSFKLKSDEKITFSDFGNIWSSYYDYTFNLIESDTSGATKSEIEYVIIDENGEKIEGDLSTDASPSSDIKVQKIEFTCTNIFGKRLRLVKEVEVIGNDELLADKEYTFLVTGPNNYSETVTLSKENGWSKMLENLEAGEYTVTEQDANVDGYYLETVMDPVDGKIQVTEEDTVTITAKNKYEQLFLIPDAGGKGIINLIICGLLLITGSILLIINKYRKKKEV